jgi:cell pole-organizing protein PopZ
MSQAAKAQEPSMEEILASIRRIIADDETGKPAPKPQETTAAPASAASAPPPPRPAPAPPPPQITPVAEVKPSPATEPDVLDLTEAMATAPAAPAAPNFRKIDGNSDIVFSDRAPESPPPPPAPEPVRAIEEPRRQFSQTLPERGLMSANTANVVDSAFNSLANTILGQNARTLEDLVKEMLRPMLKSWLDDNLPGLVERIVRAEIERVSRGRG